MPRLGELSTRPLEVARGLLEPKHREQLGAAWHFYLWLLAHRPYKNGWYLGGAPTTAKFLAGLLATDPATIDRWLKRLRVYGYIETKRTRGGIRIRIVKARDWQGARVATIPEKAQGCAFTTRKVAPSRRGNAMPRTKMTPPPQLEALPQKKQTVPVGTVDNPEPPRCSWAERKAARNE